jgi:2-polyprenyl-3-methyl-5-hydroxy-6-metoxy-1,4-benzoquinol methylase
MTDPEASHSTDGRQMVDDPTVANSGDWQTPGPAASQSIALGGSRSVLRKLWHYVPAPLRHSYWRLLALPDRVLPYQGLKYQGRTLRQGRNRYAAYRQVFPEPPSGQSILDLGCNAGYYGFMAIGEGAAYYRGIDSDPQILAGSQALATKHGITAVQFACENVLTYDIERDFDVILCLNLVHHLGSIENIDSLLDRLSARARQRLVLIVSTPHTAGQLHVYDDKGGSAHKAQVRLAPEFFVRKFGQARVHCEPARTYGSYRMLINIQTGASSSAVAP